MIGDRISSLFALLLALYVLKEGIGYDIGGLHHPGPGFFPLFGGLVLGIFSVILFLRSVLVKSKPVDSKVKEETGKPLLLIYAVVGLVVYTFILEPVGYILSTFLLLVFFLKLFEQKRWWVEIVTAGIISSASYILFAVLLKSELPEGILEQFF
jgi:putative tricarboxylic transport membrane protein